MQQIALSDINLYDIGNTIQMTGTVWSGNGISFVTLLPDKSEDFSDLKKLPMSLDDWRQFLRQTDLLETEIFTQDPTGTTKIIIRKTQRQIDSYMQWAVFKRDDYSCRYCARTGIPLTIDHIDLWEDGGATIEDNLVAACRSCNKDRGRMKYEDWLESSIYLKRSESLPIHVREKNQAILNMLDLLKEKRVKHVRSR